MKAGLRVGIEVVIALVVTYFVCRHFGWAILPNAKDGLYSGAGGMVIGLVLLPEVVRLAFRGELLERKR